MNKGLAKLQNIFKAKKQEVFRQIKEADICDSQQN